MARFILLLVLNLTVITQSLSATLYSISNGNWNNGNIWSTISHNGPSCNCTPTSADQVYIEHNVVLNKSLINQGSDQNGVAGLLHIKTGAVLNGGNSFDIDIRSTGTLYLCGSLTARNMIFSNGSSIFICTGADLNIKGNFENKNNGNNINMNGSLIVAGSFTNGSGGVITGSGSINITNGPLVNNGTIMGCVNNPCNSYPCNVMAGCATILPIELVLFEGIPQKNSIILNWTTATEINNDYFVIEKSLDGEYFSELAKIKGNGNSSTSQLYSYRDPYPENGNNYYRLKQFDFDGTNKTFNPIKVTYRSVAPILVHPNPNAGKAVTVTLNLPDDEATVEILNLSGTVFLYKNNYLERNKSKKMVLDEVKSLPPGLYTLRIISGSGIHLEKLLITGS